MKTTGIDVGPRLSHLVVLEGSARKFRIERGASVLGGAPAAASLIRKEGLPSDRVLLGVSGRECVIRNLSLPFTGREEIRKVLKFEAESVIHSHSIDDVVVDALTIEETKEGTKLFLVACPKQGLKEKLEAFKKAEVQVERAGFEQDLLVRAAAHFGVFDPEEPGEEEQEENAEETVCDLLLRLDEVSTSMTPVVGGTILTSRVLRMGLHTLTARVAELRGLDPEDVARSLPTFLGLDPVRPDEGDGDGEEAAPGPPPSLDPSDFEDALREFVEHLRREMTRFFAGAAIPVTPERILLTGVGARLPGVAELLSAGLDLPVEGLDLCKRVPGAEEEDLGPECDLALAAAMGALGVLKPGMDFRQEELRFQRRFDRLKLPLALASFLGAFFLLYSDLDLLRGIQKVESAIGSPKYAKKRVGSRSRQLPTWTGLLARLAYPSPRSGYVKNILPPKTADSILKKLAKAPPLQRVTTLRNELISLRKKLERETGYFPELDLQSGLAVLQAFADAMDKADKRPDIGRFVVFAIHLRVGTKKTDRYLEFEVSFRGKDFIEQAAAFKQVLQEACGRPGPFAAAKQTKGGTPYQDPATPGSEYVFRITLFPDYGVFQPKRTASR